MTTAVATVCRCCCPPQLLTSDVALVQTCAQMSYAGSGGSYKCPWNSQNTKYKIHIMDNTCKMREGYVWERGKGSSSDDLTSSQRLTRRTCEKEEREERGKRRLPFTSLRPESDRAEGDRRVYAMPLPQQLLRHSFLLTRHAVTRTLCSAPTLPPKVPGVKIRRDPTKGQAQD